MRTIVFISTQGGLGKSTFCLNIGSALANHSGEHPDKKHPHHQINLWLSRLHEERCRWYAAIDANHLGMAESAHLRNRFVSAAENL